MTHAPGLTTSSGWWKRAGQSETRGADLGRCSHVLGLVAPPLLAVFPGIRWWGCHLVHLQGRMMMGRTNGSMYGLCRYPTACQLFAQASQVRSRSNQLGQACIWWTTMQHCIAAMNPKAQVYASTSQCQAYLGLGAGIWGLHTLCQDLTHIRTPLGKLLPRKELFLSQQEGIVNLLMSHTL